MYHVHAKDAKSFAARFALLCALLLTLLVSGAQLRADPLPPQKTMPVIINGVNYGNIMIAVGADGTVYAAFIPAAGYTVQSVADAIAASYGIPAGQAHLNWLQICTASTGTLEKDAAGNTQYPPFVNPPAGGSGPHNGELGSWADKDPFYYNTHSPAPGSYDPKRQEFNPEGMANARNDSRGNLNFDDQIKNAPNATVNFDTFLVIDLGNGAFVNLGGFGWGGATGPNGLVDPNNITVNLNIPYSQKDNLAVSNFVQGFNSGKFGPFQPVSKWLPDPALFQAIRDWAHGIEM